MLRCPGGASKRRDGATTTATSDDSGNYRFVSLAPGSYKITAQAANFSKSEVDVTLLTEQTLNVPIALKVGSVSEAVTITTEAPTVDTPIAEPN